MRGLHKPKKVSWASDVNLCQVRLFLSEDAPSQVGGGQDHLQAKASWLLHSTGMGSDDHLPPGFEVAHGADRLKEFSQIPLIKWKSPLSWQVVAGEESREAEVEDQREMRVLEAVYPRPSAIPSSPSVSLEVEDYHHDDSHTPLIPVTPIEDEDAIDPSSNLVVPKTNPMSSPPVVSQSLFPPATKSQSQYDVHSSWKAQTTEKPALGAISGGEADIGAAASAAFTAIMRSSEQPDLIDRELLVKMLSNPELMEKLVANYGNPTIPQAMPKPKSPPMTSLAPPAHINRIEPDAPFSAASTASHVFPVTNSMLHALNPPPPGIVQPQPVKDINYYKSLIQQHGEEKPETRDHTFTQFSDRSNQHIPETNAEPLQNSKPRDSKPKNMKPCIYFNSSKGCRNGAKCPYQHDGSYQRRPGSIQDTRNGKRVKLDREITGRT